MVLKRSKDGQNTGTSFKSACTSHAYNRAGYINKLLLNDSFTQEQRLAVWEKFEKHFMLSGFNFENLYSIWGTEIQFSLNKQKRWLVAGIVKTIIENHSQEIEGYRVVLHEKRNNSDYVERSWAGLDTIGYHDSAYSCHSSYPKASYSTLTDLKLNAHNKSKPCNSVDTRPAEIHGRQ